MYAATTWINATTPICMDYLNNLETQYDAAITIGEIKLYAGSTAPSDFLLCDGSPISISEYSDLFTVISYLFGNPGNNEFNLPNLIGKFVVGYKSGTEYIIGNQIGSSGHTLTLAELPWHHHDVYFGSYSIGAAFSWENGGGPSGSYYTQTDGGSGSEHENRPQFVVLNYIIRYR